MFSSLGFRAGKGLSCDWAVRVLLGEFPANSPFPHIDKIRIDAMLCHKRFGVAFWNDFSVTEDGKLIGFLDGESCGGFFDDSIRNMVRYHVGFYSHKRFVREGTHILVNAFKRLRHLY